MRHRPRQRSTRSDLPHPRSTHLGLTAFGLILLLVTLAVPMLAGASEYRTGNDVTLGETETFTENVYISARRATFDARTTKDLNVLAANANIGGTIGGSLNILAGSADMAGTVTGSVHIAGGNVDVSGTIDGDLLVAGGNVNLTSQGTVRGDLIVTGGNVNLRGTVEGKVYGGVMTFTHGGTVGGDIHLQANDLDLLFSARVGGDLRYQSTQSADIDDATSVSGQVVRTNDAPWRGVEDGALRPFGLLLRTAWALVLGAAIIALAPRLATRIAEHAEPFLRPMVLGIVALIGIPLAAVIALVTIVGIPLGMLLMLGVALALYLSQIFVGLTLGRYVLPRSWRDGSRGFSLLAMTIGLLAISGLRMIPFPYVGAGVALIVGIWGLGASIQIIGDLTSRRTRLAGSTNQ
jgi:cytoskeletal protein CcmA (bactofilin family)